MEVQPQDDNKHPDNSSGVQRGLRFFVYFFVCLIDFLTSQIPKINIKSVPVRCLEYKAKDTTESKTTK